MNFRCLLPVLAGLLALLLPALVARAQVTPVPAGTASGSGLWTELAEAPVLAARGGVSADSARRGVVPAAYRTLKLDRAVLDALLTTAPVEFNRRQALAAGAPEEILPPLTEIELPMPGSDAAFERFSVEDSPIMEPGLAARYPEIRTYTLQGLDHPEHVGRLSVTPAGLHAVILSPRGQTFVDPYFADGSDPTTAIAYRKADYTAAKPLNCLVGGDPGPNPVAAAMVARARADALARPTGANLRTYRLALAATAEYSAAAGGGTVNGALAAMVTTVNRVNAVYEVDFAIRLRLVNHTDKLIYLDAATDPYTNDNDVALLSENQANCTSVIGNANYDLGHVFSTGGGGRAALRSVCQPTRKAQGVTGLPNPVGDPYDVDFVAHEMGHQFGGNHPFNGTTANCAGGNRNDATAYEPGSGTTIMAYAGICAPQDLAPNSDDYFHTVSYDEIDAYTTSIAGQSITANVVTTPTGNSPPTLAAVPAAVIPPGTPFALTAAATDANGDRITYCWEQFDLGAGTLGQDPTANHPATGTRDDGSSPLFRSFAPTVNPTRLFPSLTYILNHANVPPATLDATEGIISGEFLPTTARTMTFRCTARDNRAGGGGSNWVQTTVRSVLLSTDPVPVAIGPFEISFPNAAATYAGGSPMTVDWFPRNSDRPPVSCANVKISLSTDGGHTFPFVLADATPNDGVQTVMLPASANVSTRQGRIKVEAVGNVFFDINDANLTITTANKPPELSVTGGVTVRRGTPAAVTTTVGKATAGSSALAAVSVSGVPEGATVTGSLSGNTVRLTASADCGLTTTNTSRTYPLTVTVTDAVGSTVSGTVNLMVQPNRAPTLGATTATYPNVTVYRNNTASVAPPAAPADVDGNLAASPYGVVLTTVPAPTGVSVSVDQTSGIVTATATAGAALGATPVRVTVQDTCGAAVVKTFTLTVAAPVPPAFTSGPPPSPVVAGVPFSFTFTASGPPAPTFSLTAGTLPPDLSLDGTTGVLSGTQITPGVYGGLQVTASNGATPNAVRNFSLTVVDRFANYANRFNVYGPDALPGADPDGDGLVNLLEYALNLPLNGANLGPAAVLRQYKDAGDALYLSLRFTRVPLATDVTYLVEASPDLVTWTTVASSTGGAVLTGPGAVSDTGGNAPLTVEARDTVAQDPAVPAGQRRFLRLRVTQP